MLFQQIVLVVLKKIDSVVIFLLFIQMELSPIEEGWFNAVEKNDIDTIQSLIDDGFDIDTINEDGDTAFFIAMEKGNLDLVGLLVNPARN